MDEPPIDRIQGTSESDGRASGWILPPPGPAGSGVGGTMELQLWACPACKSLNHPDARRCARCDGPRRRRWWTLAIVMLSIALTIWLVVGGLLLFGMLMILGLQTEARPEQSADLVRTAGIWILGLIGAIVSLIALNRRSSPRMSHGGGVPRSLATNAYGET